MSFRQKILITLLSIVLLYSVYFWGIPSIVNVKHNINTFEEIAYDKANIKLNIENPDIKMGLLPSVWLKADRFEILNKDNSKALSINKPNLEISLLKFIIGKCHITYFSADSINANFVYTKDSKIYLGDYLIPKENNSTLDINGIKLNIQDYNANVFDKSTNQNSVIKGNYFTIRKFLQNKRYSIATDVKLIVNNKVSIINIDTDLKLPLEKNLAKKSQYLNATVTNLDLSSFSKYLSYFTNNEYYDLKGMLNFEAHTTFSKAKARTYSTNFILSNFGLNGKEFSQKYYYNDRVEFLSKVTAIDNDLYLNNVDVDAKNVNVSITGVINKITSNNQRLNIQVSSKNSKAEGLVDLLPPINKLYRLAKLEFDIETLVKAKFFADVNFDLHVIGDAVTPDVFGNLFITNAYVTPRPIPNGAKKATINLKFDKDKIYLDNVHVPASPTEYVDVTGWVKMYGLLKDVDLHITSTNNVDLAIAQYVLMPVHKVLGFELGPVPIMDIKGFGNIDLRVDGNKGDPHTYGAFNFNRGIVSFNDVKHMVITDAYGTLKFLNTTTQFITKSAKLNGKPITVNGTCDLKGNLNFDVLTKGQQVNDLLAILKKSPMLADVAKMVEPIETKAGVTDFGLNLTGTVKDARDIKFGKNIYAKGYLKLKNTTVTIKGMLLPITGISGNIDFDNTNLKLNLESAIRNSKIRINGSIKDNLADLNIMSDNMNADDLIIYLSNSKMAPYNKKAPNRRGLIIFNASYKGKVDKIDYTKLKVNGSASFNNYKCYYFPAKMPIEISNANININNSVLNAYSLNLTMSGMPIFIKGKVSDIYNTPKLNIYVSAKPNQKFADAIFNRKSLYPVKIKGDVSTTSFITGNIDNYNFKSTLMIGEHSKVYYLGANLGDELNSVVIDIDANVRKNDINIKNLTYDKIMKTNKNRLYPVRELVVSGGLKYLSNNILFDNFKIKTLAPTDSKFFNIIFKKPYIKQGQFTSDMRINGSLFNPKPIGTLAIENISIPNYFIDIDKTNFNFQNKLITVTSSGRLFNKPYKLKSIMDNNLKTPYTVNDLKLYITDIDLGEISNSARKLEIDAHEKLTIHSINPVDFSSIVINNAQLASDNVTLGNIMLHDLIAKASLDKNRTFNLNEFKFKTAKGKISGDYKVNFINQKHSASVTLSDIDAKMFTETLFNLHNQISGNINGKMDVTCSGFSQESCLKTLTGNAGFNINNGNMPKLGSLEYLLNAANIVKGGITGFSINSLIDLITPLRTGVFDTINGTISVENGNCNDIQIFSQSKNLNLFINGQYNLTTAIAQMKIFGRLTRNASNILGPVGNASLNALFSTIPLVNLSDTSDNSILEYINKIPAIELNNKKYRIFTVDINGDINGNDYVKSFNWVE